VTCLAVDGSDAVINFDDQAIAIGIVTVTVHDGNPDRFGSWPTGLTENRAPTDCSPAPGITLGGPLTSGHISIVDSQPPSPTR
jgi:hypothetical protein